MFALSSSHWAAKSRDLSCSVPGMKECDCRVLGLSLSVPGAVGKIWIARPPKVYAGLHGPLKVAYIYSASRTIQVWNPLVQCPVDETQAPFPVLL